MPSFYHDKKFYNLGAWMYLQKRQHEAKEAKEYRDANKRVQKALKKTMEDWIGV